jgi:hypothetical protein
LKPLQKCKGFFKSLFAKHIFSSLQNAMTHFTSRFLRTISIILMLVAGTSVNAQLRWHNVDSDYAPLPKGFHIFKTTDSLDGKPFLAYYAIADLKQKKLEYRVDTTYKRRMTPTQFYNKNGRPLLVVNTTFFSFATHQNLNAVIINGKLVGFNIHSLPMRGKDTFQYRHPFGSAIGMNKKRKADVAWLLTDSSKALAYATQVPQLAGKDSVQLPSFTRMKKDQAQFKKWKMKTAVGGGPVLVQDGRVKITNNEELKFAGNAINDKHPRTLMGYTKMNQLIIMVIEGRHQGVAEGANLLQGAKLMEDLGCVEALNLDGGGSSCMLINGKETILPSDKGEQRSVPAVFIIKSKHR